MPTPTPSTFTTLPTYLPLSARDSCIDAMHRFLEGIDDNSPALLRSALTTNPSQPPIFDLSPYSKDSASVIKGVDAIIETIAKGVGPMDTLHQMTNVRVAVDEESGTARLSAYALAQHKRAGEGGAERKEAVMMGNRYWVELVREKMEGEGEEWWVISRFVLGNTWVSGDVEVMKG